MDKIGKGYPNPKVGDGFNAVLAKNGNLNKRQEKATIR
jgi:hypothetical protein